MRVRVPHPFRALCEKGVAGIIVSRVGFLADPEVHWSIERTDRRGTRLFGITLFGTISRPRTFFITIHL
jgi:hypothetical protein